MGALSKKVMMKSFDLTSISQLCQLLHPCARLNSISRLNTITFLGNLFSLNFQVGNITLNWNQKSKFFLVPWKKKILVNPTGYLLGLWMGFSVIVTVKKMFPSENFSIYAGIPKIPNLNNGQGTDDPGGKTSPKPWDGDRYPKHKHQANTKH